MVLKRWFAEPGWVPKLVWYRVYGFERWLGLGDADRYCTTQGAAVSQFACAE